MIIRYKFLRSAAFLFFYMFTVSVSAAPLSFFPVDLSQPDGRVIHVFLSGDEFYNWVHDGDNYTILQNDNGYYVYARQQGTDLIPTALIVGRDDPRKTGLQPGLQPLAAAIEGKRNASPMLLPHDMGDAPKTGTINNLVIFIRFSGEAEFTDTKVKYDTIFNNTTAGANSMVNYFKEVSYNALTINSTFYPVPPGSTVISYEDSNLRSYYQPYNATTNPNGYPNSDSSRLREHRLLQSACNYVASQIPVGLNLDGDNDGKIDNVCFIAYGSPGAWADLLWPHRWALYSFTVNINSKRVYDYNFQLQTSLASSGVGVLCHEMFHSLGAPDLYHYTSNGISPVGTWDVMESNQNPPQHMCAQMKYRYGTWISSIPVISNGTYTLNPLTSSTNNCYRINSPNSATEYFLVEYRKKTGTFESKIPGSGLVVYRINSARTGNASGPPDEVYVFRPGGTLTVNGSYTSAHLTSDVGRTGIASFTDPAPFLSTGTAGGINIYNVGAAGSTITFTVGHNNQAPQTNFSATSTEVKPGDTVQYSDNSFGMPTSWQWSFPGGSPSSSTLQNPKVVYASAGRYSASLTAANTIGSTPAGKTNYITASAYASQTFEGATFPPLNWSLNPVSGTYWTRYSGASSYGNGSACAKFNFYTASSGTIQYLVTDTFATTLQGDSLRFDCAYATYSTQNDQLVIETSTDRGTNFTPFVTLNGGTTVGSGMVTAAPTTSVFVPTAAQWATKTYLLPAGVNMIRFKAVSAYGNNLYIDKSYIVSSGLYPKALTMKLLLQGFYDPQANTHVPDTVKVYLCSASAPYNAVDSAAGVLSTGGDIILSFSKVNNGTNYFYKVQHRNSIETWSAAGLPFTSFTAAYDFSSDSAKAFGDNMIKRGQKWCLFGGDVNQDGIVDFSDLAAVDNASQQFMSGYVQADLNGDDFVDFSDLTIADNNGLQFVQAATPLTNRAAAGMPERK